LGTTCFFERQIFTKLGAGKLSVDDAEDLNTTDNMGPTASPHQLGCIMQAGI
jgi:hypothetical protein